MLGEERIEGERALSYITEFHYNLMAFAKVQYYLQKMPVLYMAPFKIDLIQPRCSPYRQTHLSPIWSLQEPKWVIPVSTYASYWVSKGIKETIWPSEAALFHLAWKWLYNKELYACRNNPASTFLSLDSLSVHLQPKSW